MCFSATASLGAGAALAVLGVVTLRMAPGPRARPFAAIPLLFGLQQLVEGWVWLTLADPAANRAPAMVYSLFAHVLWPVYLPWAVRALEPVAWRRHTLRWAQATGLLVGAYFLWALLASPPAARMEGAHLLYDFAYLPVAGGVLLYLLATCGSSLWSSHRGVRVFGILSLASFGATVAISLTALVSVWCFFAALLSAVVFLIVRGLREPVSATSAPARAPS